MKFFVFLLCFFQLPALLADCHKSHLNLKLEQIRFVIENFIGEANSTLFCEKEPCHFFNKPVDPEIKNAIVAIAGKGDCSGIVIRLKKGSQTCKNPLLLTAGHCVASHDKKHETIWAGNNANGHFQLKGSFIRSLQTKCLPTQKDSCLVTPNHALEDNWKYSGVDQALIPIKFSDYERGHIPPLEIDIDKVASEKDLSACFKDPTLSATITSFLTIPHLEKMRKQKPKIREILENYIQSHSCDNLSWLPPPERGEGRIKKLLGHRCPILKGTSGSFMNVKCGYKRGLFVNATQRLRGASSETYVKAKEGSVIYFDEYKGKEFFKNEATYIDPKLLEFYFDNYCHSK